MKRSRAMLLWAFIWVGVANVFSQRIVIDTVHSQILQRSVAVSIVIPEGLENTEKRPVFYLLHSWGGNHVMYFAEECELRQKANEFPCIIVTPSADTCWYVNTKGLPNSMYEDFMEKELFPFIDSKYKGDPLRQGIGGHSMGGYGALVIGLKNPERFKFVADLSGAISVPFEGVPVTPLVEPVMKSVEHVFGDGQSKVSKRNDVTRLAKRLKPSLRPFVYVAIGSLDEYDFLLKANREYAALLKSLGYRMHYQEMNAGHFTYDVLNQSLEFIAEKMREVGNTVD